MRKLLLISLLSLLFITTVEGKKVEGKIIYVNDSIINVTFNIPINYMTQEIDFERLQYKVTYFDANGDKIILHPGLAKAIQFTYMNENVSMFSKYNNGDFLFLKLIIDGRLKLFEYYFTSQTPGTFNASTGGMNASFSYSVERYLLQKGDFELKRIKRSKFVKEMCEYFSDCPLLVEKIEKEEFGKNDIEAIVRFYNSSCK